MSVLSRVQLETAVAKYKVRVLTAPYPIGKCVCVWGGGGDSVASPICGVLEQFIYSCTNS